MPEPPSDWDTKNGPAIASCNDVYFLKNEPWLEVKHTSLEQCKEDDVMPWCRIAARGALLEAERLGIQMILGPNVVFGCSDRPEQNQKELSSPSVYRLLMLDYKNIALAKKHATYDHGKIRQVKHFMRPELYKEPFYYKHVWDVYFHIKGNVSKFVIGKFPNCTATHHGWYTFKELKYKAQHSAVCVTSCWYENYGIAIHEISLLGCPIVYGPDSMKPGSIGEGMGVAIQNQQCEDLDEAVAAIEKAMAMDRRKVWEASMEFQSVESCLETYREAILE